MISTTSKGWTVEEKENVPYHRRYTMRTYTINPDRTVTTNANKTTSFKERLDAKYPTPKMDKVDTKVINNYDEHKLYK